MENYESIKQPEELALERAQEVITQLGLDLAVTIENREIKLAGTNDWNDARVFRFSIGSDPTTEWTMDINTDPDYLENTLPLAIENAYREKTEGIQG